MSNAHHTTTPLHAGLVLVGTCGVLITGRSGAGKSTLARALAVQARATGLFGAMVADDIVQVTATGGRLIGRPHVRTAGLMEVRGMGVVPVAHEPAAVINVVVALNQIPERLPEPHLMLMGVSLPHLNWPERWQPADAAVLVLQSCVCAAKN